MTFNAAHCDTHSQFYHIFVLGVPLHQREREFQRDSYFMSGTPSTLLPVVRQLPEGCFLCGLVVAVPLSSLAALTIAPQSAAHSSVYTLGLLFLLHAQELAGFQGPRFRVFPSTVLSGLSPKHVAVPSSCRVLVLRTRVEFHATSLTTHSRFVFKVPPAASQQLLFPSWQCCLQLSGISFPLCLKFCMSRFYFSFLEVFFHSFPSLFSFPMFCLLVPIFNFFFKRSYIAFNLNVPCQAWPVSAALFATRSWCFAVKFQLFHVMLSFNEHASSHPSSMLWGVEFFS